MLEATLGRKDSKQGKASQTNLVRYADGFVITGRTKELLENEARPLVGDFLKERGLSLSDEKTRVTHIGEGFGFLGWNLRKYNGKLLTKPSRKNVKAFLQDIREAVKANKQAKQEHLTRLPNPKIRGWANYHKGAVAKVDSEIWARLWQWAKRRHPNKGGPWAKRKYVKSDGKRNWTFATSAKTAGKDVLDVKLAKASDTKIQRHIKIRGEANPFDPKQEAYFEGRRGGNGGNAVPLLDQGAALPFGWPAPSPLHPDPCGIHRPQIMDGRPSLYATLPWEAGPLP